MQGTCKFYQNVLYLSCDGVITDGNGLIYMRARYYSPDMRRFINADVVAGSISNAITLNRFAYANGNPVSMSDPFGLSAADQRGNASFNPVLELHNDPILYYVEQAIVNEQNASKQIYTGTHTPFTMAGFPMINPGVSQSAAELAINAYGLFKDWSINAYEQLEKGVVDAYNDVKKIVSPVLKQLWNDIKNYPERFFNSLANAVEFEGAIGTGLSVETPGYKLGVNKSIVDGVDDGKEYAGHKVSANIGLGIGLNYDAFHQSESDYKAIRCDSDHVYKRKTIFNILACEHTQHSDSLTFGLVSVNNSGEVCVGFSFGAYIGIGATVSFNINLTELKKGLNS